MSIHPLEGLWFVSGGLQLGVLRLEPVDNLLQTAYPSLPDAYKSLTIHDLPPTATERHCF